MQNLKQTIESFIKERQIDLTKNGYASSINNFIKREGLLDELISKTSFLKQDALIMQRVWHILNEELTAIQCHRGQERNFKSITDGYMLGCSFNCECVREKKAQSGQKLREKTPAQIEEIVSKRRKTCLEKYGVDNAFKSEQIKQKIAQTNLEKFGVSHPSQSELIKQKKKQTSLENWGFEHPMKTQEVKQKLQQSFMEKYGVNNPMKDDIIKQRYIESVVEKYGETNISRNTQVKQKKRETCHKNHGVDYPFQNKEVWQKAVDSYKQKNGVENPRQNPTVKMKTEQTCLERYGTKSPLQNQDIIKKISLQRRNRFLQNYVQALDDYGYIIVNADEFTVINEPYVYVHISCGEEFVWTPRPGNIIPSCPICFPRQSGSSEQERQLADFVESLGFTIIRNDRTQIAPKELDIWIPEKNVAIEYCGTFWHSERFLQDANHHYNKWKTCQEQGIRLLTIWSSEWEQQRSMVEQRIKHILGISDGKIWARMCEIRTIDTKTAKEFCEINHLHGYVPSQLKLGAYFNDELVSVMTFGRRKITKSKNTEWEILRFCSSHSVVGIASRLFKRFLKDNPEVKRVISFSDNRWDTGQLYEKMGFVQDNQPKPGYQYLIHNQGLMHRFNFTKAKLVSQGHDARLSEREIMESLGHYRLWDCGQTKWTFER